MTMKDSDELMAVLMAEPAPDGSGDVVLRWAAPGAGAVTVFAGTDPHNVGRDRQVGTGGETGAITIGGLPADRRWYYELVPASGQPLTLATRNVGLASVPNLRDLGGYRTTDGRWVKMGMLFRSDQLDRMTDHDLARMSDLGLGLLIDLRTDGERVAGPDRVPPGARHQVIDIAGDTGFGGDIRSIMAQVVAGKADGLLVEGNRYMVSGDGPRAGFRTLLDQTRTVTAPLLFHCTAGKDRTGWAAAVILTLLGVPRDVVMADYLASNAALAKKNAAAIAMAAKAEPPIPASYLEPVLTVRPEYLEAAFAEVEAKHGGFDAYLRDGLGLKPAEIAAIRERYLTPVRGSVAGTIAAAPALAAGN